MVVEKKIKQYANRQRIDINKSDRFRDNEEVFILTKSEYLQIKNEMYNLKIDLIDKKTQLASYKNIDLIIEETVRKTMETLNDRTD